MRCLDAEEFESVTTGAALAGMTSFTLVTLTVLDRPAGALLLVVPALALIVLGLLITVGVCRTCCGLPEHDLSGLCSALHRAWGRLRGSCGPALCRATGQGRMSGQRPPWRRWAKQAPALDAVHAHHVARLSHLHPHRFCGHGPAWHHFSRRRHHCLFVFHHADPGSC